MDENKKKFIYSKLLPWYLGKLNNRPSEKIKISLAALKIFPYRTTNGVQYGSLSENDVHWYYIDSPEIAGESSKQSYRILAVEDFPEYNIHNGHSLMNMLQEIKDNGKSNTNHMVSEEVKATPHNTNPTKENILGVEEGQGCPLRVFAMTN